MIILVRGTFGSGKTTVVRRILGLLSEPSHTLPCPTGKKPMASVWGPPANLTVLGRYDAKCGGCDTLSWKGSADDMEDLIRCELERGQRVLLEGIMVSSWGKPRFNRLHDMGLKVVHLTTPLETCHERVNQRRRERAESLGKEFVPIGVDNIKTKFDGFVKGSKDMVGRGFAVEYLDCESAYQHVAGRLGLEGS